MIHLPTQATAFSKLLAQLPDSDFYLPKTIRFFKPCLMMYCDYKLTQFTLENT